MKSQALTRAYAIRMIPLVLLMLLLPALVVVAQQTGGESDPVPADTKEEADSAFANANIKFFTLDAATLRYDDQRTQIDVYALIDRFFLQAVEGEQGVEAQAQILVKVFDSEDNLITGDTWVRNDFAASKEERKAGQKIPELIKYVVMPGQYRIEMTVADLNSKVQRSEDIRVNVEAYSMDTPQLSDIIIASKVERAEGDVGDFDHNGLLVLPNADRIFGANVTSVHYYVELYNLSLEEGGAYTVQREILDGDKNKLITLPPRNREAPAPDLVDFGSFSVINLPTGQYELKLTLTDDATGQTDVSRRIFWVYQPDVEGSSLVMPDPGFDIAAMTDAEVELELEQIRYIMTPRVQRIVDDLSEEARRAFLAKFWIANDPEPSTEINELRVQYMDRVREANARYGSFQREGWTTDRGRVFCMLGEPSYIEDHPYDSNVGKAYMVWTYDHVEGGVIFVFVDRNNYGDYMQVHSNMRGELSNQQWRQLELGY